MQKSQRWNLKRLLKYSISIHWDFNNFPAHRDITEALWKIQGQDS